MYDRPPTTGYRDQLYGGRGDAPPPYGQQRPTYPSSPTRPAFVPPSPSLPPVATTTPEPPPESRPTQGQRYATDHSLAASVVFVGLIVAVAAYFAGNMFGAAFLVIFACVAAVGLTYYGRREDWRRLDLYDRQQSILIRKAAATNPEAQRSVRHRLDFDLEMARLEYHPAEIAAELMDKARRLMAEISRRAEIDPPTQYVLDAYVTAYTAIQDAYAPFMAGHPIKLTPEQEIRRINTMLHHLDELARDSVRQKTGKRPTDPSQGKGHGGQP